LWLVKTINFFFKCKKLLKNLWKLLILGNDKSSLLHKTPKMKQAKKNKKKKQKQLVSVNSNPIYNSISFPNLQSSYKNESLFPQQIHHHNST
jgi:hypothetical protein